MKKIVIAYHSGFGHTEVIANEIATGTKTIDGISVETVKVNEIDTNGGWDKLNAADAIIFGTPTYMGSVSADFKAFMDKTSGIWFGQKWKDKLAAGFTNSSSLSGDKLNTLNTLTIFAGQHSMIWVTQGIFNTKENGVALNRMGSWLGYMAQSDNASPEITPPEDDKETARLFGKRIAEVAKRFN